MKWIMFDVTNDTCTPWGYQERFKFEIIQAISGAPPATGFTLTVKILFTVS